MYEKRTQPHLWSTRYVFIADCKEGKPPSSRSPRRCSLPSLFTRGLCSLSACRAQFEPLAHELHALDCLDKWGDWCRLFGSSDGCVSMGLLCWLVPIRNTLLACYRSGTGNTPGSKALSVWSRGPALATAPHWKVSPTTRQLRQGQPREQQKPQSCTPKMRGPGTSVEPGVQADGTSAWEISRARTEGTVISKHGEEAVLAYAGSVHNFFIARIVFTPMLDEPIRHCINYQRVYNLKGSNAYPIPRTLFYTDYSQRNSF